MARNHQDIPRETRRAELIEIARTAFAELGYVGTPLAEIARRAGVAPNAVRWYFPTKDDALAAVVDRLLDHAFGDQPAAPTGSGTGGWVEALADLLGAVGQLNAYRALAPAVNERAPHSPAVSACRERAYRLLADRVDAVITARRLAGPAADRARDALLLVLDGALTNPLAGRHAPELLHFVATSLLDQAHRYRGTAPAAPAARHPRSRYAGRVRPPADAARRSPADAP